MLHKLPEKFSIGPRALLITVTLSLFGCVSSPEKNPETPMTPSPNLPKVVATTGVLCDLTEKIAQNTLNLTCLVKAGQDPHTYQPQPQDRKAIDSAQLILYGGYDHEATLLKLINSTNNAASKVAIHEKAVPQPLMGKDHEREHGETEKHPIGESIPDPHVWHNAQNGIRIVEVITDELVKLTPSQKAYYQGNAKQLTGQLQKIDSWIKVQISTIPPEKRKLVTTHEALSYYTNAYGLEMLGALEGVTTEEQPTAQRIAELTSQIQATGVPTIFAETTVNPKLLEAVAREAKVKISDKPLYSDGLGEPGTGADTYTGMLMINTCAIVEGLGGKCRPLPNQ